MLDTETITDQEIIIRVNAGEYDLYEVLVKRYQQKAFQIAYGITNSYDDSKEAAHEAFVSAFKALGKFKKNAKFSSWLYTIVVNKSKDKLRTRQRNYRLVSVDQPLNRENDSFLELKDDKSRPADEIMALKEMGKKIEEALCRLSENQKTAFVLHYVNGLKLNDVALIMGKGLSTIKTHIHRAKSELRNILDGEL